MAIEVKCPYSRQGQLIVNNETKQSSVPYLLFSDTGLSINPRHDYYTQVQMQLYIMNLHKAILYIYSSAQSVSMWVHRDDQFLIEVVPKLEHFFFTFMIGASLDQE